MYFGAGDTALVGADRLDRAHGDCDLAPLNKKKRDEVANSSMLAGPGAGQLSALAAFLMWPKRASASTSSLSHTRTVLSKLPLTRKLLSEDRARKVTLSSGPVTALRHCHVQLQFLYFTRIRPCALSQKCPWHCLVLHCLASLPPRLLWRFRHLRRCCCYYCRCS